MLIIKESLKDSKWPLVIATLAAVGSSVLSIAGIGLTDNAIGALSAAFIFLAMIGLVVSLRGLLFDVDSQILSGYSVPRTRGAMT